MSSPLRSSSGTLGLVTMSPAKGPVTTDSAPQGPTTARDLYPLPMVKRQSGNGVQLGC